MEPKEKGGLRPPIDDLEGEGIMVPKKGHLGVRQFVSA
jgi:hypothetical protein